MRKNIIELITPSKKSHLHFHKFSEAVLMAYPIQMYRFRNI